MPAHAPTVDAAVTDAVAGPVRAGIAVLAGFFGVLGTWAALAPIAGAVIAPGIARIEGHRQSVQHRDGGIVRELLVRDGDRVVRGQVLLRLDDTAPRAALATLEATRDALVAQEARLIAERDGGEPRFDAVLADRRDVPEVAAAMDNQMAVFRSRARQFETELAVLAQKIRQLREQIAGSRIEVEGAERQLALIGEELGDTRSLYEKGYAPKTKVLALERAQAQLTATRGAKLADIARAEEQIGEAVLTIARTRDRRVAEAAADLRDTRAKLTELAPQLAAAREVLARTALTAPAAGEVVDLAVFTVGGVVAPGARVLDVVPAEGDLVVDARVRPQDIDEVAVGSPVDVRLTGVLGRRRPPLPGTVAVVSADRLEDPRTAAAYYAAQIRLDPAAAAAAGAALQAGMPAEALITTRTRSVLDYLIAPLRDEIGRAWREP